MKHAALGVAGALAFVAVATAAGAQSAPRRATGWTDYGGSPDQSKFVVAADITPANVGRLRVAWIYSTADSVQYQMNPIVVDSVMYVMAKNSSLVALDARTGRELWIHANLRGLARRGVNYWESRDRTERRLLFTLGNTLQAIDARTGRSITSFGTNGVVDLREGLGRDPRTIARIASGTPGRVFENLLILGSSPGEDYFSAPGHVRAYDVVTGRLVWTFHTIPQPGEFGYDSWPREAWKYAGGVNAWGEISLDAARGIAYVPLGSPTYDYYGADRIGDNLFGSSLVALDARTGKRLWHFQFVHHDLWDYDPTAAPQLITVRRGGRTIDAVAQATKQGFMFVFDRVTGEPVFPIEERPVPPSDVPGERASPTQPFPTVVPPFARQTLTADDLTPFLLTPGERAQWTRRIGAARKGLFVPPSTTHEVLAMPGAVGGANWGNTASDPGRGLVFVLNQDFPSFYHLERRAAPVAASPAAGGAPATVGAGAGSGRGADVFAENCQSCHGAAGAGGSAPAIAGIGRRMSPGDFRFLVSSGGAQMPAFPHVDASAIRDIYNYLGGRAGPALSAPRADSPPQPSGPVVASGGIAVPPASPPTRITDYPPGVPAPADRYSTDYGLAHPYLPSPPWSQIIAYDLNQGTIKWKVPLGEDRDAAREGGRNTGVPRGAQRHGMVVTSSGIVFSTAHDGRVYAFDVADGKVLWSAELPMGTEGLPSMFELDGKHYLVVNATTPLTSGRRSREGGINSTEPRGRGGYVVFALPSSTDRER